MSTPVIWQSNNPSISFTGTRNVAYQNDVYTVYNMQITDGSNSWQVEKRFKAFVSLNSILLEAFFLEPLPPFPKPSIFEMRFNPEVIERRKRELEAYMQQLLKIHKILHSPHLREFLRPFSLNSLVPVVQRPPSEHLPQQPNLSARSSEIGRFLLPPIPQNLNIPTEFTLDDGVCHLWSLLFDANESLKTISDFHYFFSQVPPENEEQKAKVVRDFSINLVSAVERLTIEGPQLERITQAISGSGDELVIFLASCLSAVEIGLEYVTTILSNYSNIILNQESSSENRNKSIDLNKKPLETGINLSKSDSAENNNKAEVKNESPESIIESTPLGSESKEEVDAQNAVELIEEFAERLDHLILQSTNLFNNQDKQKLLNECSEFRSILLQTAEQFSSMNASATLQSFSFRIREQIRNLDSLMHSISTQQSNSPAVSHEDKPLKNFEKELFELVEKVNSVNNRNDSSVKSIQKRIKGLSKQLADYKVHVSSAQYQHSTETKNRITNQIEDLQENLADLKRDFDNKFELGTRDKAFQKVVDRKVKEAEKQYEQLHDDMFEL